MVPAFTDDLAHTPPDTLKRYAGYDKDSGYYILEYENEARYPGKTIKVRSFQVQGVARHVIKSL